MSGAIGPPPSRSDAQNLGGIKEGPLPAVFRSSVDEAAETRAVGLSVYVVSEESSVFFQNLGLKNE